MRHIESVTKRHPHLIACTMHQSQTISAKNDHNTIIANSVTELTLIDYLTPTTLEMCFAGVEGFCIGYALKKVIKITALITMFFLMGVNYLSSVGVIKFNQNAIHKFIMECSLLVTKLEGPLGIIFSNINVSAGFIGGLALGLKKG
jgi:uncharacterized membrane protein (Fun14 family)